MLIDNNLLPLRSNILDVDMAPILYDQACTLSGLYFILK